jgi:hypothetical protein
MQNKDGKCLLDLTRDHESHHSKQFQWYFRKSWCKRSSRDEIKAKSRGTKPVIPAILKEIGTIAVETAKKKKKTFPSQPIPGILAHAYPLCYGRGWDRETHGFRTSLMQKRSGVPTSMKKAEHGGVHLSSKLWQEV